MGMIFFVSAQVLFAARTYGGRSRPAVGDGRRFAPGVQTGASGAPYGVQRHGGGGGGGRTVDPARTRPETAARFGRRPFLQADVGGRGARQRRVLRCRRLLQLAHHQVQRGRRQIGRVGREDGSVFSSQFTQLTPIDDFDSFIFFLSVFSSIVARRNL